MNPRLTLMAVAVAIIALAALGLYWKGRHEGAAAERPKTRAAVAQAAAAVLNTEGARQTVRRVDAAVRQREAAESTILQIIAKAPNSEDARAPLDPDRAARLRDADRSLCLAAPDLAGCGADRDPG
ncbi:MAG TPA: hypothetical protein VHN73_02605 [Phenylobacterium sp.]|nr:hypothetical protein [Phenylobacterium sp.]